MVYGAGNVDQTIVQVNTPRGMPAEESRGGAIVLAMSANGMHRRERHKHLPEVSPPRVEQVYTPAAGRA
jgi:hypothetical protein